MVVMAVAEWERECFGVLPWTRLAQEMKRLLELNEV